jgi:hypothetical protein
LVETKNGAVIRKHMGYGYLDAAHAAIPRFDFFWKACKT